MQVHLNTLQRAWSGQWRQRVLRLALPIIVANISVPLTGIVDTAVMGRMDDPVYMGAVALGAIIFSSIFWLFGFLRMGTGGLVAQAFGASQSATTELANAADSSDPDPDRNWNQAKSTVVDDPEISLVIYRAILIGAVLGVVLVLLQKPIAVLAMKAFSGGAALEALASDYFYIRIYAAPATLITYSILGALIGLQQMRAVLLIQLLLNFSNIVLTILFFHVFDGGVKGVALATVIAEYLSLFYAIYALIVAARLWPLSVTLPKILDPLAMKQLFVVNANLMVRTLSLTIAFYWLTESGVRLGTTVLAANSILLHMLHFSSYAMDGFAHAAETLCGNAYGRARRITGSGRGFDGKNQLSLTGADRRPEGEFTEAAAVCFIWGVVFSLVFVVMFWIFGHQIIALMSDQPPVQEMAATWLWWIIFSPLVAVTGFILDGIYIGVTHTRDMRNAMLQSVVIFLLANLILVKFFGNTGLWISYYILMIVRALTLFRTYPRIMRAMQRSPASIAAARKPNTAVSKSDNI